MELIGGYVVFLGVVVGSRLVGGVHLERCSFWTLVDLREIPPAWIPVREAMWVVNSAE